MCLVLVWFSFVQERDRESVRVCVKKKRRSDMVCVCFQKKEKVIERHREKVIKRLCVCVCVLCACACVTKENTRYQNVSNTLAAH